LLIYLEELVKKNIFSIFFLLLMAVSMNVYGQSITPGTFADVEEARQRAIDFECPAYFPSDWENLEERFVAIRGTTQTAAVYSALAAEYDEIFRKTIPIYAQAWEDIIITTRYELFDTGFSNCFPEYLNKADEMALIALAQFEAGDYYTARETASRTLFEFETLVLGARAFAARQELIDRDFVQFDVDNFARAEEVAQSAIMEYDVGSVDAAIVHAIEALLRYNMMLSNGWTVYAYSRKEIAARERELALAERTNISSRETFRLAEVFFIQAEEIFESQVYSEAALIYVEAEALFAISRKETEERRLRALEAIRMAEEKIEESGETAVEAERIIEGGSR
jgi:hypothetical protein